MSPQPGWEPPNTPALWGRLPQEYHEHHEPPREQSGGCQPGGGGGEQKSWDQHQEQQVSIHEDERKHGWDGLSDERKKQLEVGSTYILAHLSLTAFTVLQIGGGLVAGLAALGAGYFAYKHHEKSEDEVCAGAGRLLPSRWASSLTPRVRFLHSKKKAHVWALQNWLHEADQRTREFYEGRARAPVTWILVDGGRNIPTNIAIVGGEEHGTPHYICRGYHEVGRG